MLKSHVANLANSLDTRISRLQHTLRALAPMHRFIWCTRALLAIAFIPTGLVKVLGERFTLISIESDVGLFFEGLYRTGLFWNFIGWTQVASGILILIPRTTTLGAVAFFPIIFSIVLITVGMGFRGTWIVTSLMLLASTALLLWDYHRLRPAFAAILGLTAETQPLPAEPLRAPSALLALERAAFVGGLLSGFIVFAAFRSLLPMEAARVGILAGLACAAALGCVWIAMIAWQIRRRPRPAL